MTPRSANYVVAVDGEFELVFGTSASTPVTASILSAINDARLVLGKKPIGFINPTVRISYLVDTPRSHSSLSYRSTPPGSRVRSTTSSMVPTKGAALQASARRQDGILSQAWVRRTSPNSSHGGYCFREGHESARPVDEPVRDPDVALVG